MNDIPVQTLLAHRYQIDRPLGQGGMGVVYRAFDNLTGQKVALKRMSVNPDYLSFSSRADGDSIASLATEFRILASLRHPNVVSVIDYGFDADRQPFYTMNLLENGRTIVGASKNASEERRVQLLVELLQALAYLHRRGVIHRDLKPANVLVDSQGVVKVLDFGLSLELSQITEDNTGISGTMMYMSPELMRGELPSVASDLYAVGIIACEMLTGRYPYDRQNPSILINNILSASPDLSDLDQMMKLIIGRLLAKDPSYRYESAEAVIDALREFTGYAIPNENRDIRESFLKASRFIGREEEFSQLTDALRSAAEGQGSAWVIGGESGVGKSRLIDELKIRALVDGGLVLRGYGIEGSGVRSELWRDVAQRLVLVTPLSDLEASILKPLVPMIEDLLGRAVPDAPTLDGKATRSRLAYTLLNLFQRQNGLVVLLLEDLQWAQEDLEPLKLLAQSATNERWLIVADYRDDEAPDLPAQLPHMQSLKLPRLHEKALRELSASMLGEAGRRSEIVDFLLRETEGNVFFIVEVVRALAEESGSLSAVGQKTLPKGVLTSDLQRIIRRRLERAPASARRGLGLAAVAGRYLDLALIDRTGEVDLDDWLTVCTNAAILEISDGRWRFTHDKLRETLLLDLPDDEKRDLNRSVAEAIEAVYPDRSAYAVALARHWDTAGVATKAVGYILQAASELITLTADYPQARSLLQRGIELSPPDDLPIQAQLYLLSGDVEESSGAFELAKTHYQNCLRFAEAESLVKVRVLNGFSKVLWRQGELAAAEKSGAEALALSKKLGSRKEEALSLNTLGGTAYMQGKYEIAKTYYQRSLKARRRIGDQIGTAATLQNLGAIAHQAGDYQAARAHYRESLSIREAIGARQGIAVILSNLSVASWAEGDYAEALRFGQQSLKLAREIGNRAALAETLMLLGMTLQAMGNYAAAEAYFEETLQIAQGIGNPTNIAHSLNSLGDIEYLQGRFERAAERYQKGLVLDQELGNPSDIARDLNALGVIARDQGDLDAAEKLLQESHNVAREVGHPMYSAISAYNLATIAAARGNLENAIGIFEKCLTDAREMRRAGLISECLIELTILYTRLDQLDPARACIAEALTLAHQINTLPRKVHTLLGTTTFAAAIGRADLAAEWVSLIHQEGMLEIMYETQLRDLSAQLASLSGYASDWTIDSALAYAANL